MFFTVEHILMYLHRIWK